MDYAIVKVPARAGKGVQQAAYPYDKPLFLTVVLKVSAVKRKQARSTPKGAFNDSQQLSPDWEVIASAIHGKTRTSTIHLSATQCRRLK